MKSCVITVLFLLIINATTYCQEVVITADELLRFFPKGDYEEIHHIEMGLIRSSEWCDAFMSYSRFERETKPKMPITDGMWAEIESVTMARQVRIFVSVTETADYEDSEKSKSMLERRRPGSSNMRAIHIGGLSYNAEGVGEDLLVLRFLDPAAWLKKTLESGEIAPSGEVLAGQAVYRYSHRNAKGFGRTLHLTLYPTGEILAAEKLSTLRRMAATGRGEELCLLDDVKYHFFEEMLNVEGHYYWLETKRPLALAIIKYVENKDGINKEGLQEKKDYFDDPGTSLALGEVWRVEKALLQKELIAYREKEYALQRKARADEGEKSRRAGDRIGEFIDSGWRAGVSGGIFIEEMEYDEARIENLKERKKEFEKKAREYRRKKVEQNKESGK